MEKTLPPARQQRSRDTEERLLNAALALLEEGGLDAALIPRIAELAQVAPASVYRRFADKSALLRAAFLTMLRASHQATREQAVQLVLRASLAETLRQVANRMMQQYREHPQLLRALVRFMQSDTDAGFVTEARAIIRQNTDAVVEQLMAHRAEVRHVPKRAALHFAVTGMACTIESFALDQESLWHADSAMSDQDMAARVAHTALAYLLTPLQ
ncbi:helix-turn-helix domain-containing protein [Massilia sp. SR12]